MSAISPFPQFSSTQTQAYRAPATGRAPTQGGVLSSARTNPKMHSMYYGVQSAVFMRSTGASGSYRPGQDVRLNGPQITQSSLGTTYGRIGSPRNATAKNPNTGSIKSYGSTAAYTNRPWESANKPAGAVLSSSSQTVTWAKPSNATGTVCIPCQYY